MEREKKGERPTEGKGGGESEEEEWRNRQGGRKRGMDGERDKQTDRTARSCQVTTHVLSLSSLPVICIQPRHDLSAPLS